MQFFSFSSLFSGSLNRINLFLKQHFRDNKPASLAKTAVIYQVVQEQAGRDGHMDKTDTTDTLFWNLNEKYTGFFFFFLFSLVFLDPDSKCFSLVCILYRLQRWLEPIFFLSRQFHTIIKFQLLFLLTDSTNCML